MEKSYNDDLYLNDEDISKTQKLELDRYQKYLKSIKKYDPLDEEEYLYLTAEMGNIINNNSKLSDIEVLELTRKLEKIENTKDYTVELLELTRTIKKITKQKQLEIPKVEKKKNPIRKEVKPLTATSLLPKINRTATKSVPKVSKRENEKEKPKKEEILTFKDLVDKNTKNRNNIDHFNTEAIRKIRTSVSNSNVKKKKKPSKASKFIWSVIFILSLCSFVFLMARFIKWQLENNSIKNQIDDIYSMMSVNEVVSNGAITDVKDEVVNTPVVNEPQNTRPSDYWYYMSMSMLDVDFKELKAKNNETAGWIQVAGTNVNYPYVHTSDNKYYLKHSFDKSYNSAGWVFLDYRNEPNEFGRNNILYAHGRLDNTMFGSLKKIVTPAWYNNSNNYVIKTSTEEVNALWQVFSVYTILPESYYIRTRFDDSEFETFLNTITSRSVHNFNVITSTDDKILTLSTCYDEKLRVVLHAKLIKIEEK